ncbi:MAG: Unknown protein [uncultured Aureispira sp.]|uniref:Lipoprotein n=1 Tax=uncultured Aureispira sp. TaxID=1331704 RepID=A0A6S6SH13_9BACT|nr:MAG: Unknown protein [uncultured Aureispira sp.]
MKRLLYLLLCSFLAQSCDSPPIGPSDRELEKMTRFEKWDCLEKRMTKETVVRILGKPSSKKNWSGQTSYTFECFLCETTFDENGKLWSWHSPEETF